MGNGKPLIINIELNGKEEEQFDKLKSHLGLKQNTEVIRASLKYTTDCLVN